QTGAIPFNAYTVSGLLAMGAGVYGLIWRKKREDDEDGE
ncbi:MAG: LPXTG cell wall anchor domain-containing protein, partial [Clostridia bacterium]|nr:LPXTG cell wall anchor domain-containing protein [Clostridia bacterium]